MYLRFHDLRPVVKWQSMHKATLAIVRDSRTACPLRERDQNLDQFPQMYVQLHQEEILEGGDADSR